MLNCYILDKHRREDVFDHVEYVFEFYDLRAVEKQNYVTSILENVDLLVNINLEKTMKLLDRFLTNSQLQGLINTLKQSDRMSELFALLKGFTLRQINEEEYCRKYEILDSLLTLNLLIDFYCKYEKKNVVYVLKRLKSYDYKQALSVRN